MLFLATADWENFSGKAKIFFAMKFKHKQVSVNSREEVMRNKVPYSVKWRSPLYHTKQQPIIEWSHEGCNGTLISSSKYSPQITLALRCLEYVLWWKWASLWCSGWTQERFVLTEMRSRASRQFDWHSSEVTYDKQASSYPAMHPNLTSTDSSQENNMLNEIRKIILKMIHLKK